VPSIISSAIPTASPPLPGPKARTPLGHLLAFRRDALGFLSGVAAEYGDVAWFRLGSMRVALLNHPDYIREVLQTNHRNFVKGRPLHLAKRLLGEGLLTSEGDLHASQSRVVQPAFHGDRIEAYGAVMRDYAARWGARWHDGTTIDVLREMTTLATAIAGKTMFLWDVDSAEAAEVGSALTDAMRLFSRASLPFAERLLELPLPSTRRFYRAKAHLDATITGLIAKRRGDGRDHGDLLSMLLGRATSGHGDGMSDTQVRDEALTLFLTALDTTSLALTWTWYVLSQHPAVEARLHAEIEQALGGRDATSADVDRLPYARMVFSEAMRLYPPIYAIAREAVAPFTIGPYTVPAGTLVLLSPYVMHRDPRYYRDPDQFDPERWASPTTRPPRFTYFPFGGGPRGCIGQSYAMQEAILVLATLARRWRLRLAPGHQVAFQPLINLRPRYGMRMVPERRR
jgi:cytochrome P450